MKGKNTINYNFVLADDKPAIKEIIDVFVVEAEILTIENGTVYGELKLKVIYLAAGKEGKVFSDTKIVPFKENTDSDVKSVSIESISYAEVAKDNHECSCDVCKCKPRNIELAVGLRLV